MKTIYYYQSFTGLSDILQEPSYTDVIIVSSLHFGKDSNNNTYIHLNNNFPTDKIFNKMWEEVEELSTKNITIMLMLGGAGGAYQYFFDNYDKCYNLLIALIKSKKFIKGIDLDIEEAVDIKNVQKLIKQLKNDLGNEFIITMAPVCESLLHDQSGMGNFIYKDLYNSEEGKLIEWYNTQSYGGSFTFETVDGIVKNKYPPEKIVMGMMSGDFDSTTFKNALTDVDKIKKKYPNFGGVFDWEYLDAPPTKKPSDWAKLMKQYIE